MKRIYHFEPFLHTATSTKTKKETVQGDASSQKEGNVAAHLRIMQPAPTSQKDTQRSGKTQTVHTFNQTQTIVITCIFKYCAYIRIRIEYVYLQMHIFMGTSLYGTKLIRTRTEPLPNKRVFIE